MTEEIYGQQPPSAPIDAISAQLFFIQQYLASIQTACLVRVISCTNSGGIAPTGTVDVQPLVNQISGDGTPEPHGVIHTVPYLRMQGGALGVILDPSPGDRGLCVFCSRDISLVVANRGDSGNATYNPGTRGQFNWRDAIYLMGVLTQAPTDYVAITAAGINVVSQSLVSVQAPQVVINGNGQTTIDGEVFLQHKHTGGTIGGDTGPVLP